MQARQTAIEGVWVVETPVVGDERGSFYRAFCDSDLLLQLAGAPIRQINLSRSQQVGTVRGLHFQYPPQAEHKLVRCLRGRVFDLAVDLRSGSPTFLSWHAQELSPENRHMLLIPPGCAHGFQCLEADSELLYLHTAPYQPELEGGVRADDPRLAIRWPLPIQNLSSRDQSHAYLSEGYRGIQL